MQKDQWHKVLDELCEWRITADTRGVNEDGSKRKIRKDHTEPIQGYDVVLSHYPKSHKCDHCHGYCSKEKTYRRAIDSQLWTFHCKDCGESWKVTAQEIIHPPLEH